MNTTYTVEDFKNLKSIVVHGGVFNADDVFTVAYVQLLRAHYGVGALNVVRTLKVADYMSFDNGYMVGMSTPWMTLELLYYLKKADYSGTVYFDTFPVREDCDRELVTNCRITQHLLSLLDDAAMSRIDAAMAEAAAVAGEPR